MTVSERLPHVSNPVSAVESGSSASEPGTSLSGTLALKKQRVRIVCVVLVFLLALFGFAYPSKNYAGGHIHFRVQLNTILPLSGRNGHHIRVPKLTLGIDLHSGTGNRLFQWASAMGIARKNNASFCAEHLKLPLYFEATFPPACPNMSNFQLLKEKGFGIYENHSINTNTELAGYFQSYKYFAGLDVRNHIKFKKVYQRRARKILAVIRDTAATTLVGVHIRRGDHVHRYKFLHFPPVSYFERAMEYYRSQYHPVKFVVVSDEMAWVEAQPVFREADTQIVSGNGPIVDLAILANCDHGVMSIGTFGWWGNYLAGGECIFYNNEFNFKHPTVKNNINLDDYYLPHWVSLGG